ncbi:MAG: ERF family protein [Bacillota bacterium]|nr:ERF family protein [Bacillota bacterium]
MNVYEKLMNVQSELKAPKSQYNKFGDFYYRGCEDILEGVKPLLNKYKATLIINDEIVLINDRFYIKATATFIDVEKGEKLESTAFAREALSKPKMDDSQVTGSTSSYARKYALNALFCIDDTKDADSNDNTGKDNKQDNKPNNKPSENKAGITNKEMSELIAIANKAGFNIAKVKTTALKKYNVTDLLNLTKAQYEEMCNGFEHLQQKAGAN